MRVIDDWLNKEISQNAMAILQDRYFFKGRRW